MSKQLLSITHRPYYEPIRDVWLNRGGVKIGQIVRWRASRLAYLSWRHKEHYFVKFAGFGVDTALLRNMIKDDGIELIIIEYSGPRGLRYFISNIDDWIMYGINVQYNKDTGNNIETYGTQKILPEKYMNEIKVKT